MTTTVFQSHLVIEFSPNVCHINLLIFISFSFFSFFTRLTFYPSAHLQPCCSFLSCSSSHPNNSDRGQPLLSLSWPVLCAVAAVSDTARIRCSASLRSNCVALVLEQFALIQVRVVRQIQKTQFKCFGLTVCKITSNISVTTTTAIPDHVQRVGRLAFHPQNQSFLLVIQMSPLSDDCYRNQFCTILTTKRLINYLSFVFSLKYLPSLFISFFPVFRISKIQIKPIFRHL